MFSEKLSNLMNRHPENQDVYRRLGELYEEMGSNPRASLPLLRMLDKLHLPPSLSTFSIIRALEVEGVLRKIIRVESPSQAGLEDFDSIMDVPEVMEDFRTGMELKVTAENIKVLYSINISTGAGVRL
jgi:hypothetical protein